MKNTDILSEYLNRIIQTADKASETSEKLRNNPEPKHFDKLHAHLQEITDHLSTLQSYLDHQNDYALDELADWLSTTTTGKHANYRHSPDWKH